MTILFDKQTFSSLCAQPLRENFFHLWKIATAGMEVVINQLIALFIVIIGAYALTSCLGESNIGVG